MQIVLLGIGPNDLDRPLFKTFELEMVKTEISKTETPKMEPPKTMPSKHSIPKWIKNNAGWWADGKIDDNSFTQGIQFLIKENIMNIPSTQSSGTSSNEIPSWIKNNAKWWADGTIGDSDFVSGIQYLIQQGIIKLKS